MAVRKLSVAIDSEVAALASANARRAGSSLSAWLDRAARHELVREKGLAAVAAWEAEHGELTPDELARADAVLSAGPKRPRTKSR